MGIIKKHNRMNKKTKAKKEEDIQKRLNLFHKEYKELTAKYKIDLSAELDYKNIGVMATIKFIDLEAREAEENKKPALAK